MIRKTFLPILWLAVTAACNISGTPTDLPNSTNIPVKETGTFASPEPTETIAAPATATATQTSLPTETTLPPTETAIPTLSSLKAQVTADKLSCRYGPGAEYLYLFALNATANIELIGRTDANDWVWVNGTNKCWVKASFLAIDGDPRSLPIVYPDLAKLPVSPYYPGPAWAKAARKGNAVDIYWEAVPISPGKYEDEFMHQYIIEVWRCENGQIIFETLGTNFPYITVANDEQGCAAPSHGNVYVQEKHGYGGPAVIPWPEHEG